MILIDSNQLEASYLDLAAPRWSTYLALLFCMAAIVLALVVLYRCLSRLITTNSAKRELASGLLLIGLFVLMMGGLFVHFRIRDSQIAEIRSNPAIQQLYKEFMEEVERQTTELKKLKPDP